MTRIWRELMPKDPELKEISLSPKSYARGLLTNTNKYALVSFLSQRFNWQAILAQRLTKLNLNKIVWNKSDTFCILCVFLMMTSSECILFPISVPNIDVKITENMKKKFEQLNKCISICHAYHTVPSPQDPSLAPLQNWLHRMEAYTVESQKSYWQIEQHRWLLVTWHMKS